MHEVSDVDVFDDGNPTTGVRVSRSSRWMRPGVILGAVTTCVLAMVSMAIMVIYLTPAVERLTEDSQKADKERTDLLGTIDDLQTELNAIRKEQLEERAVDDCVALYLYDIEVAKGGAQLVLGDSLAATVSDEADREQLAKDILEADAHLREALEALRIYREIDPPPDECPHPEI